MNQSILFADIQKWDEARAVVEFSAQQAGVLVCCTISKNRLSALSGIKELNAGNVLDVFCLYRFDIEEIAEEMIEDELFNDLDQIEIS